MSRPNPNSNTNEQDEEARRRLELRFILRMITSEWENFRSFQPGTDNINCRCNQCNTNDNDDKGKS